MRNLYFPFTKILTTAVLFFSLQTNTKAQVLVAGDIAFTGYNAGAVGTEAFSFVLLVSVPIGTVINFTDNGWSGTLGATEQTLTWTSTAAIPAGREIRISGPSAGAGTAVFTNGSSAGTCTGVMPSFATAGDQILAYQGAPGTPTFISGLHMNQYHAPTDPCGTTTSASWDPPGCGVSANSSQIPAGLVAGTSANWIGNSGAPNTDADNAVFNCTGPLTTAAQVRAAVNNPANWVTENGVPTTATALPSRCTFMGLFVLPVQLVSFTGKLNADKSATLQWKVSEQEDIDRFIIEESTDGNSFHQAGVVAKGNSDMYSFIDISVQAGKNYYRLKIVELSGEITYSNTIMLTLKSGVTISVYPNPVTDKLTIQQFGTTKNTTAILSDGHGKLLQQVKITGQNHVINMEGYPAGVYVLKLGDGTVFKVMKQ